MHLISADGSQISLLQNMAARTWPDAYGAILSPGQIAYMLELFYSAPALLKQLESGHQFLILKEAGHPLGFAGYQTNIEAGTTKLHKLYVLPEAQGKGAGYRLLEAVKEAARTAGDERLTLNVNRYNKAKDFYERNGFRIIREEDIDIGEGFYMNDYIMECPLLTG